MNKTNLKMATIEEQEINILTNYNQKLVRTGSKLFSDIDSNITNRLCLFF